MKHLGRNRIYYILTLFLLTLFSCNSNGKLTIEEISESSNKKIKTSKFSYGSSFSYSFNSSSKSSSDSSSKTSKEKLTSVKINFSNKKLSEVLDELGYLYSTENLIKNPLLNVDYYKGKTTKEKAGKQIFSELKKMYDL